MEPLKETFTHKRGNRSGSRPGGHQPVSPERRGHALDGLSNRDLLSLLRSGRLQRKARVSQPDDLLEHEADRAGESVTSSVESGGRPLDEATRGALESRFGESFGDVRIYTGHRAGRRFAGASLHRRRGRGVRRWPIRSGDQ
jgi:hypothetical protein